MNESIKSKNIVNKRQLILPLMILVIVIIGIIGFNSWLYTKENNIEITGGAVSDVTFPEEKNINISYSEEKENSNQEI